MDKETLTRYVFYFMLILFGVLIGIGIFLTQYNDMIKDMNYLIEYGNNCTKEKNFGLYKELTDDGLSNETYILNNGGFEVVNIGR